MDARRIIVVGGEKKRHEWPPDFDIRFYFADEIVKLKQALRTGRCAHVINVVKFSSHNIEEIIAKSGLPFTRWPGSFDQLARDIPVRFAHLRLPAGQGANDDWIEEMNVRLETETADYAEEPPMPAIAKVSPEEKNEIRATVPEEERLLDVAMDLGGALIEKARAQRKRAEAKHAYDVAEAAYLNAAKRVETAQRAVDEAAKEVLR